MKRFRLSPLWRHRSIFLLKNYWLKVFLLHCRWATCTSPTTACTRTVSHKLRTHSPAAEVLFRQIHRALSRLRQATSSLRKTPSRSTTSKSGIFLQTSVAICWTVFHRHTFKLVLMKCNKFFCQESDYESNTGFCELAKKWQFFDHTKHFWRRGTLESLYKWNYEEFISTIIALLK